MEKVFIFQKTYFKVKVLKTFKMSTDCHIKTCWSLKQMGIFKIPSIVFKRTYALSVGFKVKPLREIKTKTNPNFAVKLAERSYRSFLLFNWWITFLKHLYSLICNNGTCIELNSLCNHMEKVRSSQAAILILNWLKHSFSLWL